MRYTTRTIMALLFLFTVTVPASAQDCPASVVNSPGKKSTLYVYFPTAVDNSFPEYGINGQSTSPVSPFDMSQHDANITTTAIRSQTLQKMRTGYCEFDVKVKLAAAPPAPAEDRWQVVAIGSDLSGQVGLSGKAQNVDTGDAVAQDFCRVWVSSLQDWVDAELTGANSTAERWATAIANLALHETSHNYGASHGDAIPVSGEDAAPNHFIADPSFGATPDTIVDRLNHHSDTAYEKFGHDLGLAIQTLHNWDFVNPNAQDADAMTIRVLSKAAALNIGWFYGGSLSPWTDPTVTKQNFQLTFQSSAYNVFDVKFETAKSWSGGANGVVPGGEMFHLGATFLEDAGVIVFETTLHSGSANLPLRPRLFGYDTGTASDGNFNASFFNTGAAELLLSDVQVLYLPRMVSIEEMVVGGALRGIGGMDVAPFARQPRDPRDLLPSRLAGPVRVTREPFTMTLARLTDRRHLDRTIGPGECKDRGFGGNPEVNECPNEGTALSLFPATYTYVMATVTDPNAHYWDKRLRRYVDGPLSTRFFFQVAGEVPDANGNGVDDLLDIRRRTSRDGNDNGIPDEAEDPQPEPWISALSTVFRAWPLAGSASALR
jgi:hypothetical protein